MKGYKVFNSDWTCRGFQYEVGKTYEMYETPIICEKGFHFCTELKNCFNYYPFRFLKIKIAEVEALGDCYNKDGEKYCTNKIKIIREIPINNLELVVKHKVLRMFSLTEYNVGEIIDSSCKNIVYSDFPMLEERVTVLSKLRHPHYHWGYDVQAYVITDVKIKEENENEGL